MPIDPDDSRFADWQVHEHEDSTFVGVATGRQGVALPVHYDRDEEAFFGVELDPANERLRRIPDQARTLEPAETVGEGIERLGDSLGWESLSEFAEEHVEDDES